MPNIYSPDSANSKVYKAFLQEDSSYYLVWPIGKRGLYNTGIPVLQADIQEKQGIGIATNYYIWLFQWNPSVPLNQQNLANNDNWRMLYRQYRTGDKIYLKPSTNASYSIQAAPAYTDSSYTNTIEGSGIIQFSTTYNPSIAPFPPTYFMSNSHQMWGYDINNFGDPNWDTYILESTVPYDIDGSTYVPDTPQPFFFSKDNFDLVFGMRCTPEASKEWEGNSQNSPVRRLNDINHYYYMQSIPIIRFTSPVDGTEYSVRVDQLKGLENGFIQETPNFSIPAMDVEMNALFSLTKETKVLPWLASYQALQGDYEQRDVIDASFSAMEPMINSARTSLSDLINYFSSLNPNFSPNDIYTTVYMDYPEYIQSSGDLGPVMGTRELDFSSLYGTGIDPRTDGGDPIPGSSWDPLPGHENDDTSPNLNPQPTNHIDLNQPVLTPYGIFNRTYALTSGRVNDLGDLLSTTDDNVYNAVLDGLKMFGAKPMDAIIDLRLYPFDVLNVSQQPIVAENIILGRYNTNITGVSLHGNSSILDLGSIYIKPKFNSFLDYEPYTTIRLYIPYIGTVELAPSIYMGRTVSVRLVVDYITGASTAIIYANGLPMTYQQGIIGISIAMTGDNASAYANGIVSNLVGAVGSAAKAVSGTLIPGMEGSAVKNGVGALTELFDMGSSINDVKFQQAGSSSPAAGMFLPQKCHIMIARPDPVFEEGTSDYGRYGYNIGYATAYTATIHELWDTPGIFYGVLTHHSGAAANEPTPTEKEIDMIKQTLNNGFYIVG